jgi:hypothetical protein
LTDGGVQSTGAFGELDPQVRQALLEQLAMVLERNAKWAGAEGDDSMEMVMHAVGSAMRSAAAELASREIVLAENVVVRALSLISAFHYRHPRYPVGPTLH